MCNNPVPHHTDDYILLYANFISYRLRNVYFDWILEFVMKNHCHLILNILVFSAVNFDWNRVHFVWEAPQSMSSKLISFSSSFSKYSVSEHCILDMRARWMLYCPLKEQNLERISLQLLRVKTLHQARKPGWASKSCSHPPVHDAGTDSAWMSFMED